MKGYDAPPGGLTGLKAACECFRRFRRLHAEPVQTAETVLLGDYYFSLFSSHLIPLDSVALIDAFSAYLRLDAAAEPLYDEEALEAFFRTLPAVMRHDGAAG
ncbi:MAG: hypothetical protein Q4C13_04590 [Clostridia bacterium]|nr:hypothetical protein [Clostridia bacterium]